jgi:hypothetical protein
MAGRPGGINSLKTDPHPAPHYQTLLHSISFDLQEDIPETSLPRSQAVAGRI